MEYEITKIDPHHNGIRVTVLENDGDVNQYNFGPDWLSEDKDGVPRWKHHLDGVYQERDVALANVKEHCECAKKKFLGRHNLPRGEILATPEDLPAKAGPDVSAWTIESATAVMMNLNQKALDDWAMEQFRIKLDRRESLETMRDTFLRRLPGALRRLGNNA